MPRNACEQHVRWYVWRRCLGLSLGQIKNRENARRYPDDEPIVRSAVTNALSRMPQDVRDSLDLWIKENGCEHCLAIAEADWMDIIHDTRPMLRERE